MEAQKDILENTLKKNVKITQYSDIYAVVGKLLKQRRIGKKIIKN